ncbi:MAG: dephospho-CoA kinase [Chromatiaceae bacterium]|nr:dephospho-CoA kinase [Chromatiaceae bacterium]
MLTIALTGGIGSGKSTVADRFTRLGVPILDADVLAHALTAPGEPTLEEIRAVFGPGVIQPDGALDRAALRRIVFDDPAARRRLEAILHPRIRVRMLAWLGEVRAPYAILVIPLLFETGQSDLADRILVVDLPEDEQVRRVQSRSGLDAAEIHRILATQASRAERLAGGDDRIDNSGDLAALEAQVKRLHHLYLDLAQPVG